MPDRHAATPVAVRICACINVLPCSFCGVATPQIETSEHGPTFRPKCTPSTFLPIPTHGLMMDSFLCASSHLIFDGAPELGIPALYVHDLTGTPDAERLLANWTPLVHPASKNILPRLQQFAPGQYNVFMERSYDLESIPFRLITTTSCWTPGSIASYKAISYSWHNDEWAVTERLFCGVDKAVARNFAITPAMLRALLAWRNGDDWHNDNEGLWIDQICINQANEAEKAVAVANMDIIYRNARDVTVLLEDVDITRSEEEALEDVKEALEDDWWTWNQQHGILYVTPDDLEENLYSLDLEKRTILARFCGTMMAARWFSRAWCVHEYQLNRQRTIFLAGHKWPCIAVAPQFIADLQSRMASIEPDLFLSVVGFSHTAQSFTVGASASTPESINKSSLFEVFCDISRSHCFLTADKLSIALNVSGLMLAVRYPLPNLTEDVCRFLLALVAFCAGDASVLSGEGDALCGSWVRWPTDPSIDDAVYEWTDFISTIMPNLDLRTGLKAVGLSCVILDMIIVDNSDWLPLRCSAPDVRLKWDSNYVRSCGFLAQFSDERAPHLEKVFLTSSLNAGMEFMQQAVYAMGPKFNAYLEEQVQKLVSQGIDPTALAFDHLLTAGERKHLERTPSGKDSFRKFMTFILGMSHLLDQGEIEYGLLLHGFSLGKPKHFILPRTVVEMIDDSSQRIILAIPVIANNPDAIGTKRVWVLQQTHDDAFYILSKGYLFDCGALEVNEQDITALRDIVVTGSACVLLKDPSA